MTGYLLDTNVALIALAKPTALSTRARRAILAGPNILSAIVYWEVLLKTMKGTLRVGEPRVWWFDALEQLAATPLTFRPEHVGEVYTLPPIHKDPFDRALIAQAMVETLTMVTTDGEIPKYACERFRVLHWWSYSTFLTFVLPARIGNSSCIVAAAKCRGMGLMSAKRAS